MQSPLDGRVPAIFVHVRKLARAVQFYQTLLGLPATNATEFENIVVLRLANGVDLILDANHADEIRPVATFPMHATCMFSTDDIDASYQFMQDHNVELITEIYRDANVAFFTFKDPDGNVQMVCANRQAAAQN